MFEDSDYSYRRKVSISAVIAGYKVKYELLQRFINIAFEGSEETHINIYIDLYSIIRSIYADKYDVVVDNYFDIVTGVVNIAIHYKYYFKKYLGVESKVFIIAGDNCPKPNSMLIMDYNKTVKLRKESPMGSSMKQMLNENIELLNTIVPYIPDIYFFQTQYETSVCMKYIIDKQASEFNNTAPNIIVTKDIYPMQLVTLDHKTALLRPKKSRGSEMSFFVNPLDKPGNIIQFWTNFLNIKRVAYMEMQIHPCNLSLVLAFNGMQERNIKSLMSLRKINECIFNAVGNLETFCAPHSVFSYNPYIEANIPETLIMDRYKAIDINFQVKNFYSNSVEAKTMEFKNKRDMISLRAINDRYFAENPINLQYLV